MFGSNSAAASNLYSSFAPNNGGGGVMPMRRLDYSHDVPPLGCNPDAMKLFVGNIPKTYTADSLRPLFEAIGTVVELVVVRDKLTDESKGSAFVWYQTRSEAERAIAELHLRRVLQDPTGEQDRPLVVRRANPKVAPVLISSPMLPQQPPLYQSLADTSDMPAHLQGASFLPHSRPSIDTAAAMHLNQQHSAPPVTQFQMMQEQFNSLGLTQPPLSGPGQSLPDAEQLFGRLAPKSQPNFNTMVDQNCSLFGQTGPPMFPSLSNGNPPSARGNDLSSILQSTLSNALNQQAQQPPASTVAAPNSGSLGFGQMTLALHVGRGHVTIVATNLHQIQGNTGAMVQLSPGTADSYVLLLSGNDSQLDSAKSLVHDLIAQSSP